MIITRASGGAAIKKGVRRQKGFDPSALLPASCRAGPRGGCSSLMYSPKRHRKTEGNVPYAQLTACKKRKSQRESEMVTLGHCESPGIPLVAAVCCYPSCIGTCREVRRARFGPGPRRQARWAGAGLQCSRVVPKIVSVSGNSSGRAYFRISAMTCGEWSARVRWRPSPSAAIVTQFVTRSPESSWPTVGARLSSWHLVRLSPGVVVVCHRVTPGWNKAEHPLPCGKSSATSLICAFSSQHFSSYPASSRSHVPSLCPRWRRQPDHPGRVKERHPLMGQNDT